MFNSTYGYGYGSGSGIGGGSAIVTCHVESPKSEVRSPKCEARQWMWVPANFKLYPDWTQSGHKRCRAARGEHPDHGLL